MKLSVQVKLSQNNESTVLCKLPRSLMQWFSVQNDNTIELDDLLKALIALKHEKNSKHDACPMQMSLNLQKTDENGKYMDNKALMKMIMGYEQKQ